MKRYLWFASGPACLLAAAALALLADDVRRWPAAVRAGDVQARVTPANGDPWRSTERIPLSAAERLLGIREDLAYRRGVRLFYLTQPRFRRRFGPSFVPPVDGARRRLREIQQAARDPETRSAAANLLAVLTYEFGGFLDLGRGRLATRYVRDAVRLDPRNEQAKFNLELLLDRSPEEQGSESGGGGAGETSLDDAGAASTPPGRGY
jgi:hypothetical protein